MSSSAEYKLYGMEWLYKKSINILIVCKIAFCYFVFGDKSELSLNTMVFIQFVIYVELWYLCPLR